MSSLEIQWPSSLPYQSTNTMLSMRRLLSRNTISERSHTSHTIGFLVDSNCILMWTWSDEIFGCLHLQETNFEMPELVKVNGLVSGYPIYYMTLRAKDKETNITETFVARVAQLPYNRNVESSIAVKLVELKSLYKNTDNAGKLVPCFMPVSFIC